MQLCQLKKCVTSSMALTAMVFLEAVVCWARPTLAQYYPYPPSTMPSSPTEYDSFARDYANNYPQGGGILRGTAGRAIFGGILGNGRRGAGRGQFSLTS
jgi:hypothetical protein